MDEALYPSIDLTDSDVKDIDHYSQEKIEEITNSYTELADNIKELFNLIDRLGTKIAVYEIDGILTPISAESLRELESIKRNTPKVQLPANS